MVRGIIVRLIVMVAVPMSFLNPFAGVLWYLWYSHFRPNDFIWPQYAFTTGAFLIAGATLAGYAVFEMRRSPIPFRGLTLVVLFYCWIVLSAIFATDHSLAFWKLLQYTKILVMTLLVSAMANSEERIRAMLTVAGLSVGLLGFRAAVEFLLTGGQFRVAGVGGVELEANEFALALNMAIPMLVGLSYVANRRVLRYAYRFLALCCVVAVVGTFSRSGLLGLCLAVLLVAWYSPRRVLALGTLALVALVSLPLVPERALLRYESIPTAAELDPSAIARIQTWETALQMIKAHPLLGVGLQNFQGQYSRYFLDKYKDTPNYRPRAPHNAYISLAAECGIPATLLFASFLGSAIFTMSHLRHDLRDRPSLHTLSQYCLIIQMTLIVYLVPNVFISRQDQDLMCDMVGISVGLAALVRSQLTASEPESEPAQPELSPVWENTG